ncbi:hypothetical protein BDV93DRAFT_55983 [Ceratobasidium sp. AG-I]|nr:hypothetical protein BDV93DRAFT_55983 [Ceratobasidium sp. AG-I]
MEKFSAWRDPGTGVQPFLTPVPPQAVRSAADYALIVVGGILGLVRCAVVLVFGLLFGVLYGVCLLLSPIPPLHRMISWLSVAIFGRVLLFSLGFWSISTHITARKARRVDVAGAEKWTPTSGDIIVSNWGSWVEVLWLTVKYNPLFVLPVCASPTQSASSSAVPLTPGRRTGTGSAQIATSSAAPRQQVLGFRTASFLEVILATGQVPPYGSATSTITTTIEDIRAKADRPIVVFPECTTSNGRALLRFADVFIAGKGRHIKHPVKGFKMYIMCARYDPPTSTAPSATHSIPSQSARLPNPLSHLLSLLFAPTLTQSLSIRLLSPSDSPSSGSFMASEVILDNGIAPTDEISEACAVLMTQMAKIKRVGMGWEDKAAFLDFYRKRKSL